jgi:hypothetical protein
MVDACPAGTGALVSLGRGHAWCPLPHALAGQGAPHLSKQMLPPPNTINLPHTEIFRHGGDHSHARSLLYEEGRPSGSSAAECKCKPGKQTLAQLFACCLQPWSVWCACCCSCQRCFLDCVVVQVTAASLERLPAFSAPPPPTARAARWRPARPVSALGKGMSREASCA